VGSFKGNKKRGNGQISYEPEITFEGTWNNNTKEGKGAVTDHQGAFIGEFLENKRNGNGLFASSDKKTTFKGRWVNDIRVEGELNYEYRGKQFVENIKDGKLLSDVTKINLLSPDVPPFKMICL